MGESFCILQINVTQIIVWNTYVKGFLQNTGPLIFISRHFAQKLPTLFFFLNFSHWYGKHSAKDVFSYDAEINKNRNKTNEKNTAKVKSILERLLEYKPKMCQYVYKEPL